MDPDKAYADMQEAVAFWDSHDREDRFQAGEAMADCFKNLDEWLSKGGFLPKAWNSREDKR